jgi:Sigma-70, region 4
MSSLELLAPDQRAVLELVIRQGRSYGELSELLGIPEREVRERAEGALRSLAGEPADPSVDTGRITDWLLGQQPDRAAAATAERVGASEPARAWAADVAERLREIGGESVPAVPDRQEAAVGPAPRPRPLRDPAAARTAASAAPAAGSDSPATGTGGGTALPAASRTGGAILIGVVVLVLVALLVWPVNLLGLGGDSSDEVAATPSATPTATASSGSLASQATGNDVVLAGTGANSKAEGLMRLFKSNKGAVQFAIGVQNVPNNAKGESYAVWFTRKGGAPKLLGFPQTQVTNGTLTVGGPTKADQKAFPEWFATYDKVLITRETSGKPKQPGTVVVAGTLPHGKSGS